MQLFKNFCDYTLDKNGVLEKFELKYPDNYNFGYDVVDEMAKCAPNDIAVQWTKFIMKERHLLFLILQL